MQSPTNAPLTSPPRPGTIAIYADRGAFRDSYWFVARDPDGNFLLKSPEYIQPLVRLGGSDQERVQLQRFIDELAVLGWQAVHVGPSWADYRIYYLGPGMVAPPQTQPQRHGLSVGAMWGWSVVIVIVLFALCVVLVLSVELHVGPA